MIQKAIFQVNNDSNLGETSNQPVDDTICDAKYHDLTVGKINQRMHQLLCAIRLDKLKLDRIRYLHDFDAQKELTYVGIHWDEFSNNDHHGIINIAKQNGSLTDLFYWYISAVAEVIQKPEMQNKIFVIDIFSANFLQNRSICTLLQTLLKLHSRIVYRLPFDAFYQDHLQHFLLDIYHSNSRLMVNLGKRVIDISPLSSTPIAYIEMDSNKHILVSTNNCN